MHDIFKTYKSDIPAGLVVYPVALPLSLGIALASGAPLFSSIVSGIIGGVVIGHCYTGLLRGIFSRHRSSPEC